MEKPDFNLKKIPIWPKSGWIRNPVQQTFVLQFYDIDD